MVSHPADQQRPPLRPLAFALLFGFLLLLLALPAGMYLLHQRALGQLEQRLSAALGTPVQIGGIWATFRPSLVVKDLRLGAPHPLVQIARSEVALSWALSWPPKIRSVRLLQPKLAVQGDALLRWLRQRRPAKQAGLPRPGRAGRARELRWIIEDGQLSLRLPTAAGPLQATSRGIYSQRSGDRQRLILGPSSLRLGQLLVAESTSLALDLDPQSWQLLRLVSLAGRAAHPRYPGVALTVHRLSAQRTTAGIQLTLEGKPAGRHTGRLWARALLDPEQPWAAPLHAALDCQQLALASLAPILEAYGLQLSQTIIDGQILAQRQGERWRVEAALEGRNLTVTHPFVASSPAGPLSARLELAAAIDPEQELLQLERLQLTREELQLELQGRYQHRPEGSTISLDLQLPPTSCQSVLAALPPALVPNLQGMALAGNLGARGKLHLTTADLERTTVDLRLQPLTCKVLVDPPRADVHRLLSELTVEVPGPLEERVPWVLGPSNPDFFPLSRISPRLRTAFMVAEDSRFYQHDGFDVEQLRRAFVHNLQSGALRGGSTISQQLVKNIFLNHDRTLTRKLEEAVLTWRMEQLVTKDRILELYLNVIEMGPGIHGVGQASRRYFGRPPSALTTVQAARLAALAPSPRQLARRLDAPRPDLVWTDRIDLLLRLMRRREAARQGGGAGQLSWLSRSQRR